MVSSQTALVASWICIVCVVATLTYIFFKLRNVEQELSILKEALGGKAIKAYLKEIETRQKRKIVKRYLVMKVSPIIKDRKALEGILQESIRKLYGSAYLSLINPKVLYFNVRSGKAVVRFPNEFRWKVIASLSIASKEAGGPITPLRIAGTLRKAKKLADE